MTHVFDRTTRLEAWLDATEYLLTVGADLNVILSISSPGSDGPHAAMAYDKLDEFYASEKQVLAAYRGRNDLPRLGVLKGRDQSPIS